MLKKLAWESYTPATAHDGAMQAGSSSLSKRHRHLTCMVSMGTPGLRAGASEDASSTLHAEVLDAGERSAEPVPTLGWACRPEWLRHRG